MASDSPPSPAVAGRDIAVGISGKSSPVGAVSGGGDEICKNGPSPPPCAVAVECLLDPSVPVAATQDGDVNFTVSTAVAGDGPNVGSGCGPYVGVGAGISSDGSNGHSSTDSAVIESDYPDLQPQYTNLVPQIGNLETINFESFAFQSPVDPVTSVPNSMGGTPVLPPAYVVGEGGRGIHRMLAAIGLASPVLPPAYVVGEGGGGIRRLLTGFDYASLPISMGDTSMFHNVEGGHIGHMLAGIDSASLISRGMGGTVIRTGNVEGGLVRRMLAAMGLASPVLPPAYVVGEGGRGICRLLTGFDYASLPISMGGTSMFHNVEGGHIGHMLAGIDSASLISRGMGGTVIRTGNVEGGLVRRMLAAMGLASPIRMGDTLVIQTGDVEAGYLLTGSRFGVGRSDITPMNDHFRMYIVNSEPRTGNYPPPLEISGDNSHLVRPLEQHLRSNCFVILFVTSEMLGMVFEIIYQESHIMAYFFIWIVCVTIAMYAARLLAMIEGGMANREQFAVYLRCFSFLLLELLQYWGIHQGNYVTALKIILRVTGAIIGWWVVGVLQSYMEAFGMHLPLRRRED